MLPFLRRNKNLPEDGLANGKVRWVELHSRAVSGAEIMS